MTRTTAGLALVAALLGGAVVLAAAEAPKTREDDLALVKRAVASNQDMNQAVSPAPRPQAEAKPAPRAAVRDHDPQWFKVRVIDKATGKRKVTVNLPLSVVKVLGDDMPIDWPCGDRGGARPIHPQALGGAVGARGGAGPGPGGRRRQRGPGLGRITRAE